MNQVAFKKFAPEPLQPAMLERRPLVALRVLAHPHKRLPPGQRLTEATQPARKHQPRHLPLEFKLRTIVARKTKTNNCQVGALQDQVRSSP